MRLWEPSKSACFLQNFGPPNFRGVNETMFRKVSQAILLTSIMMFCIHCNSPEDERGRGPAASSVAYLGTDVYNDLNPAAGATVLYEVQARTANACHPEVGAGWQRAACRAKIAPKVTYRAEGQYCGEHSELEKIRLGTLDDLRENSSDYHQGITLRYIKERVGANTVWLMPLFPNNDRWNLPGPCDNLGSPYAVRDYLHVRGTLSRRCISAGRDEYAQTPCWGNEALEGVIAHAHALGLKVLLDVAFNHFGHNYLMYDYGTFRPVRERISARENLERLWDHRATFEEALLHPELLDRPEKLEEQAAGNGEIHLALDALRRRCPGLAGDDLVRAFNAWRVALDWERARFSCDASYLEYAAPGFYLGSNRWQPSQGIGDNFSNNWVDVKFLYHHEENVGHNHEFIRQREYLFRIMNYWVSRGVDGFRLDHTTDHNSGIGPNEWKYIIGKVDYYAWRRGQDRPLFLAEEFHDSMGMNHVVDIMTEGYLRDMTGRGGVDKSAGHAEWVIDNMLRFKGHTYVMTALETHDERRLTDGTGFNIWTGAGFWGIGAAAGSTPMLLMGQEFGEPARLGFRKSDFLRSRFIGTAEHQHQGELLTAFYKNMIDNRLSSGHRALQSSNYAFLRSRWSGRADPRLLAMVKWSEDKEVLFAFFNLWEQHSAQSYYIPSELARRLGIMDQGSFRFYDLISKRHLGPCRSGAELKWALHVEMDASTRMQWLKLEACR